MGRCKNKTVFKVAKGQTHFNQADASILNPIYGYRFHRKSWPVAGYVDFYMMNAWIAMKFLEDEGLCSHP